jgi:predicted O-linked N-acetylglucosamine transferase (SPINDLY family)
LTGTLPPQPFAEALACWRCGHQADAEALCRAAIDNDPADADGYRLLAEICTASGRSAEAVAAFQQVVRLAPRDAANLRRLAHALLNLKRPQEALAAATQATLAEPEDAEAFVALGLASVLVGMAGQALGAFDRALSLQPTLAKAYAGRGLALAAAGRGADAVAAYARAAELDPRDPSMFLEVGHLMLRLGRFGNAHAAFCAALDLAPNHLPALEGRTKTLIALCRHEEALPGLVALYDAAPREDYLRGLKLHAQLHCCDWSEFDVERRAIAECARRGERADNPLAFIVHNDSPADQRRCAQLYALDRCSVGAAALRPTSRPAVNQAGSRLRVAYLSADFGDHPVAQLMAGVFESHDRSRIETYAFSAGANDHSRLRQRLERGFDHFLEVTAMQDAAIAARMVELSIDVAVDLGGHTTGSRTRVLAYRPAPIQVAFLGFPGTLGADFIDYIIADRHVIPQTDGIHYTEQVIYLPDTYLPNDFPCKIQVASNRREAGLPAAGMVFCSFNAPYKISPTVFDVWMRILRRVPASCGYVTHQRRSKGIWREKPNGAAWMHPG